MAWMKYKHLWEFLNFHAYICFKIQKHLGTATSFNKGGTYSFLLSSLSSPFSGWSIYKSLWNSHCQTYCYHGFYHHLPSPQEFNDDCFGVLQKIIGTKKYPPTLDLLSSYLIPTRIPSSFLVNECFNYFIYEISITQGAIPVKRGVLMELQREVGGGITRDVVHRWIGERVCLGPYIL